jgi:hypothetical protein
MARRLAAARSAGALSAAVVFVDGRPGATLGFLLGNAAAFVALLDMLRFPFLLVGVFRLFAAWHWFSPALRDGMLSDKPLTPGEVPYCRLIATSQSRTIAPLISEAAIMRMISNCSNSAPVTANPASGRRRYKSP